MTQTIESLEGIKLCGTFKKKIVYSGKLHEHKNKN